MHDEIEICDLCGKELDEVESFNYDGVCESCMHKWEVENNMLIADYYKSLL